MMRRRSRSCARLALSEEHLRRLTPQLESILEYVAKIGEAEVSGAEPMAHATGLHNVLREDVAGPALPLERTLANAPEVDGNRFSRCRRCLGG